MGLDRQVRTARRVIRRWREDGRLPPATRALLIDGLRRRVAEATQPTVARLLPVRGGRPRGGRDQTVHRHGWRRWRVVAGGESAHTLQHLLASRVMAALEAAGLAPFVVDADGLRITIGLPARDRADACRALQAMPDAETWFVEWWRGSRQGITPLSRSSRRLSLQIAERWGVYQLQPDRADTTLGRDIGPLVTFWAEGAHDRLELVGRRGLDRFPKDEPRTVEEIDGIAYTGTASFPVSSALHRVSMPIDVVYTWVDGDDPEWRAERDRCAGGLSATGASDAVLDSRFRSRDELLYSLRSLHRYAGWVRRVFVVTADQRPEWLVEDDRLTVVPHSAIFPAEWLPTFNSHAIESRLHHIPDLAEHFIYFNDDFFLGRPVPPSLFFSPSGASMVFEGEAKVPSVDSTSMLGVDAAAVNGQRLIKQLFGRTVERKLLHSPYALRRSTLFEAEQRCADIFEVTGASRFRAVTDVSIASAFAHHYGLCIGSALPGSIRSKYVNLENAQLDRHFAQLRVNAYDTFCLNETEVARESDDIERRLAQLLEALFPHPSPWERRQR